MYVVFLASKTPDASISYTAYLVASDRPKKAAPRSCRRVQTSALVNMYYYVERREAPSSVSIMFGGVVGVDWVGGSG